MVGEKLRKLCESAFKDGNFRMGTASNFAIVEQDPGILIARSYDTPIARIDKNSEILFLSTRFYSSTTSRQRGAVRNACPGYYRIIEQEEV